MVEEESQCSPHCDKLCGVWSRYPTLAGIGHHWQVLQVSQVNVSWENPYLQWTGQVFCLQPTLAVLLDHGSSSLQLVCAKFSLGVFITKWTGQISWMSWLGIFLDMVYLPVFLFTMLDIIVYFCFCCAFSRWSSSHSDNSESLLHENLSRTPHGCIQGQRVPSLTTGDNNGYWMPSVAWFYPWWASIPNWASSLSKTSTSQAARSKSQDPSTL